MDKMSVIMRSDGRMEFHVGRFRHVIHVNTLKAKGAEWFNVQPRIHKLRAKDQEKIKAILDIVLWEKES